MALNGTLSDLGIVDLVQFPVAANKTGELIIAGVDEEARLYYRNGRLQHAMCGGETGLEAMIHLVGWTEGEFEFRLSVTTDESSIETEMNDILTRAITERESRAANKHQHSPSMATDALQKAMQNAAARLDYLDHVALYSDSGELICCWDKDTPDESLLLFIDEIRTIFENHPRKGLNKVYLTDTRGTCIASLVNDSYILLLSANDLASLGMVSLASTKMTAAVMEVLK